MSLALWNDDYFFRPFEMTIMPSMGSNKLTKDFMPLMGTDLIESEKDYNIHVDLPGVAPEDVEVTIVDKYLCIKAERNYMHEENVDKVHSMERAYGKVQRKIRIPMNADLDHCETAMKNGVLTIIMPKTPVKEENIRKIAVNAEKKSSEGKLV